MGDVQDERRVLLPPFTRAFLHLAAANVLSNLMVPLAGLVDSAFLGHLAEIHYLGGVALATVLFNYLYWSFGFLRMGMTGLVAQALGREEPEELWLLLGRSGAMALAIGLGILLLQGPIQALGFGLLNGTAEVQAAGVAFFQGRIWGAPAVLLNFVVLGWLLGQGRGRPVLLLAAVANGANVLLDYGFVVRLGWASYGAGLATALSQMLALGVGAIVVWRAWQGQTPPHVSLVEGGLGAVVQRLWHGPALRGLLVLNRDILIRTFALVTAFSLFTNFSSALGETVLAANALLLQVISLAAYFIDGLAFATETFAGRLAGAGQRGQLRQLLGLGGGLSLALGLGFSLMLIGFPGLFAPLTNHGPVQAQVAQSSVWLLPILGVGSLAYLLDGYFLGLAAGRVLRNAAVLSTGVFFLPVAVWAWWVESGLLLWVALSLLMVGRVVTLAWALRDSPRPVKGLP